MPLTTAATGTATCDACGHSEPITDNATPAGWLWISTGLAHTRARAVTLLDALVKTKALAAKDSDYPAGPTPAVPALPPRKA